MAHIEVDHDAIARFCKANGVRKLALFESILRDGFGPDSDVDVLVEFEPNQEPGLIRLSELELELSKLFSGREVDLRTPEDFDRYIRERVVTSAQELYAA